MTCDQRVALLTGVAEESCRVHAACSLIKLTALFLSLDEVSYGRTIHHGLRPLQHHRKRALAPGDMSWMILEASHLHLVVVL